MTITHLKVGNFALFCAELPEHVFTSRLKTKISIRYLSVEACGGLCVSQHSHMKRSLCSRVMCCYLPHGRAVCRLSG